MNAVAIGNTRLKINPRGDLLLSLLDQQHTLSAVETFAYWHEQDPQEHQQASHYRSLMPTSPPADDEQFAFSVDMDACSGCKACVVACHNLNGLEAEETWRKVGLQIDAIGNTPLTQHVTTACHHCEDPACLNGCPVLAYEKDPITGIVRHLDDQCFGCQYCTLMCPYEVPQYSKSKGIVRKCDMCSQRLAVNEAPACVQACPNQAISIEVVARNLSKTADSFGHGTGTIASAPPPSWTKPTTRYRSKFKAQSAAQPVDLSLDLPHHAHFPLVWMLVLSQAAVGLFLTLASMLTMSSILPTTFAQAVFNHTPAISIVASTVGIIGIHLAMLHLGRPHLFFRSVLGWRKSWLSREAIVFGGVMASWSAATTIYAARIELFSSILNYLPQLVADVVRSLSFSVWPAAIAAFLGAVGLFCSAMIYIVTRRALWSPPRTFSLFVGTSLAMGPALMAMILAIANRQSDSSIADSLAILMVVAMVFSSVSMWPLIQAYHASRNALHITSLVARQGLLIRNHLANQSKVILGGHAIISLCAVGVLVSPVIIVSATLAGLGCIALFVAQVFARSMYFSAMVTYRMPGGGI